MEMDNNRSTVTLVSVYCFIIAVTVQPSLCADIFTQCARDADCDSDEYCSDNMCEICVPCESWLNRQPAFGVRKCAKTEDECGSCLPGFQSEELTNQRRSYKCAPIVELQSESAVQELQQTTTWEPFFVGIVCFAFAALATMATCFFTRRGRRFQASTAPKSEETEELILPSAPCLPLPPPPPYNPMIHGVSPVDETDYRVPLRHEFFEPYNLTNGIHVGATPIGPYHHYCEPELEPIEVVEEEVNIIPVLEVSHATSNDSIPMEGSTETIPSQWEPDSVSLNVYESQSLAPVTSLAPPTPLYRVRSQSFEHLPFFVRPEHGPVDRRAMFARSRSRSDPQITFNRARRASFAGETYAHRHVRLSAHRSQNNQAGATEQTTSQADNIPENTLPQETGTFGSLPDACDVYEADAPSPFAYSDDERHSGEFPFSINLLATTLLNRVNPMRARSSVPSESPAGGSSDSGFFDDSRRRRSPNEEIEIGVAFYAKRVRHN